MTALALPLFGGLVRVGILAAVQSQAALSLDAEVGAGSAPYVPGEHSVVDINTELRPAAAIRLRAPGSELILRFGPRFYYRLPLSGEERRPLVLGQTALLFNHQMSERLRWLSQVSVTFGEANYAATESALKTPLARGLTAPAMNVLTVQGFSGLNWDASRTTHWDFTLVGDHNEVSTVPASASKSNASSVGAVVSPSHDLTQRDTVSLPARARYYFVDSGSPTGGADTLLLSLGAFYRRTLARRTTLSTLAGLSLARIEQPLPVDHWVWKPAPQAYVTLDHVLYEQGAARVSDVVTASIEELFDPTLNTVYPVAGIASTLSTQPATYWSLWFAADAYSAVTRTAAKLANSDLRASASVGATRRLAQSMFLMFGTRAAVRSSQLWADEFQISEKSWTVFCRFSIAWGLARDDDGSWAR